MAEAAPRKSSCLPAKGVRNRFQGRLTPDQDGRAVQGGMERGRPGGGKTVPDTTARHALHEVWFLSVRNHIPSIGRKGKKDTLRIQPVLPVARFP